MNLYFCFHSDIKLQSLPDCHIKKGENKRKVLLHPPSLFYGGTLCSNGVFLLVTGVTGSPGPSAWRTAERPSSKSCRTLKSVAGFIDPVEFQSDPINGSACPKGAQMHTEKKEKNKRE